MLHLFLTYVRMFQRIRARQSVSETQSSRFRLYECLILALYIGMYVVRTIVKDIITPLIAELTYYLTPETARVWLDTLAVIQAAGDLLDFFIASMLLGLFYYYASRT